MAAPARGPGGSARHRVATQAVLLFWWVGFYPGTLSFDSVAYVWQVSTGNWTTQHSVLYNGLVWLSLRATGQLALLTLAQTVALAAGLAYAVVGLRRIGAPGRWVARRRGRRRLRCRWSARSRSTSPRTCRSR